MNGKLKSARQRLNAVWILQVRVRWRSWRSGFPVKIQRVFDSIEQRIKHRRDTVSPDALPRLERLLVEARRLRDDPDKLTKAQSLLAEMRALIAANHGDAD